MLVVGLVYAACLAPRVSVLREKKEAKKAKIRDRLSPTPPSPPLHGAPDPMADAARSNQTAVPPLAAGGWAVQLVVNEKTLLRPTSVFAYSSKAYTAYYDVQQLTLGLRFAVVWHDGRPNPAPSVGTCWIQQGGEQSPTTLIGSSLLVPAQQRWATLTSKIGKHDRSLVHAGLCSRGGDICTDDMRHGWPLDSSLALLNHPQIPE